MIQDFTFEELEETYLECVPTDSRKITKKLIRDCKQIVKLKNMVLLDIYFIKSGYAACIVKDKSKK